MRVAHILRKYNPAEWGGTETARRQVIDGLRGHGVDTTRTRSFTMSLRIGGVAFDIPEEFLPAVDRLVNDDLPARFDELDQVAALSVLHVEQRQLLLAKDALDGPRIALRRLLVLADDAGRAHGGDRPPRERLRLPHQPPRRSRHRL